MLTAEWQAVLAVGDRALFAYRIKQARLEGEDEQGAFVEDTGISQQTLSEWERGEKVHVTTAMLYLAAHLTGLHVRELLERPTGAHTAEGRVFWMAVEAELAARQRRGLRLTVAEVIARATAPRV
jgi:transcriptional regulator with XRE-family HTH domain